MKLYRVSCIRCGWRANRLIDENDSKQFIGHRCRVCLERDPASTQTFKVRELVYDVSPDGPVYD